MAAVIARPRSGAIRRDLAGWGTSEAVWGAAGLPARLPVREPATIVGRSGRVVVVAPHPDDEVLGVGGTIARLVGLGVRVTVVAVTDGEASHPGRVAELRRTRAGERAEALRRLGLDVGGASPWGKRVDIRRLGLPDGGVDARAVADGVRPLLAAGDVLLAPWRHDGHPDHDACGEAAVLLGLPVWSYLVWAWHWAGAVDIPWRWAGRIPLGARLTGAKRAAVGAFVSQVEGAEPILPPHVLSRLVRSDEVLLLGEGR